nr:ribonuclease H-like domain-containing protein [Tanacetum cinerariifolium]
KKGLGYESYHAVPPHPTGLFSPPKLNLSNSGLEEFKQPKLQSYGPKSFEFVRPKQQEKPVRKTVRYAEMYMSPGPRGNQRNWNNQNSQHLGSKFVMYNKACFVCGGFEHVQANCSYHQRERVGHLQMVQEDQGYVDSGYSRHMIGNMSCLSEFKEFDGGYVTFRRGVNGGRITGKGTLKTGKMKSEMKS